MPESDARGTAETLVAIAIAGAVIYFAFTEHGRQAVRKIEQWLDEGEKETDRLVQAVGRLTALGDTVAGTVKAVQETTSKSSLHRGDAQARWAAR